VPDLAVEVLSETNTQAEMDDKLEKYFRAGVRLVWYIDPATRSARAFTSQSGVREISLDDELDGGDVLTGFRLSLRFVFEQADRRGPGDSWNASV
jgi:Uma2 family endonuclease